MNRRICMKSVKFLHQLLNCRLLEHSPPWVTLIQSRALHMKDTVIFTRYSKAAVSLFFEEITRYVYRSTAIWLCYAAFYIRCSTVSLASARSSQRTLSLSVSLSLSLSVLLYATFNSFFRHQREPARIRVVTHSFTPKVLYIGKALLLLLLLWSLCCDCVFQTKMIAVLPPSLHFISASNHDFAHL